MTADIKTVEADDKNILAITRLFQRFFEEGGFSNIREAIAAKSRLLAYEIKVVAQLPTDLFAEIAYRQY